MMRDGIDARIAKNRRPEMGQVRSAPLGSCRRTLVLLAVLASFAAVSPAGATVVENMDLAMQAATADRIFVGTVTAVTTHPNVAAPSYVETIVTLAVEESVTDSVPATVELRMSGGSSEASHSASRGCRSLPSVSAT